MARNNDAYGALSPEYDIPIPKRTRSTDWARTIAFALYFNACILFVHSWQYFIALLYPFAATRALYEYGIQYTKRSFGRTIVAITQLFAPTTLVITCSDELGNVIDPEKLVRRNAQGDIEHIELPKKSVWISNHQVYTDWLYLWCLGYYADLADSIFIMLMNLYKWLVPIGPAMQFFRFIFLARKWETDKAYLARHLNYLAYLASDTKGSDGARGSASKLLLLLFPEGTLVSPLTRPTSKKFADKSNIDDCANLLLPRSTGLLFSLRSLAADVQDLKLVDFTIGYPGVPSAGRAQEFYTLRSTFMQGVAPPVVHVHFTVYSLAHGASNAPPIGTLPTSGAQAATQESTQEDKDAFGQWLLTRWREKDDMLTRFYKDGDFLGGSYLTRRGKRGGVQTAAPDDAKQGDIDENVPYIEVPLRLKQIWEFGDTVSWFLVIPMSWLAYKAIRLVI